MSEVKDRVYEIAGVAIGADLPQYTSFGCYTILYVTKSGACLCAKCASANTDENDPVVDAGPFWEGDPEICAECGREIESSYGPVE